LAVVGQPVGGVGNIVLQQVIAQEQEVLVA
jgi:hypothetical protein